jgi:polyisoprenyl-phosphate glycosyltransferase
MNSITAIIPAYNEEKTVAEVIKVVQSSDLVDKVIVVSDGSEDETANIAREFRGIEVIELIENLGKGGALRKGMTKCDSDIILLLDADLVGLTTDHIETLIYPVKKNIADMTIGIFNKGRISTDFAQRLTPYLSGQRAIKREIIEKTSSLDITRYGLEVAVTKYAKTNNVRVKEVPLYNLTHMMKEEKFGLVKGFSERVKMYWDVMRTFTIKSR